ncbi:MAG: hypothetical protein RLZZ387_258 [Chloroflexota bacterium]|jgi:hypothetical protein
MSFVLFFSALMLLASAAHLKNYLGWSLTRDFLRFCFWPLAAGVLIQCGPALLALVWSWLKPPFL